MYSSHLYDARVRHLLLALKLRDLWIGKLYADIHLDEVLVVVNWVVILLLIVS